MMRPLKKIVITSGEPAGIGVDICLKLPEFDHCETYILADPNLVAERARQLNIAVEITQHHAHNDLTNYRQGHVNILPHPLYDDCTSGQLNAKNSQYVLDMLDTAADLCIKNQVHAMITGPVQKSIINEAGIEFTGHTEYLADKSGATPVMMLAHNKMRVALATTHLPLKDISAAITHDSLTEVLTILNRFLINHAGIKQPHILVCGLNPHAGENGNLGTEEIDTIIPVVNDLNKQGINLTGPLPADTLFNDKYLGTADAVLAMYHDQGLPVLKYSGFGNAVNITLGLPFIRTSVDHGTALDLAGTGLASNSSLIEAIKMALSLHPI